MDTPKMKRFVADATKKHFSGFGFRDLLRGTPTQKGTFSGATREIKRYFADLGHELNCLVASCGVVGTDGGEWLYDLVWYTNSHSGNYRNQVLVLESELRPGGAVLNSEFIDDDFLKLIQARADIRVWIAAIPTEALRTAHLQNCKQQIADFQQSQAGDFYIFILFDWTSGTVLVEEYIH